MLVFVKNVDNEFKVLYFASCRTSKSVKTVFATNSQPINMEFTSNSITTITLSYVSVTSINGKQIK